MNRRMYLALKMVFAYHTHQQHCVTVTQQGRPCSKPARFHDFDDTDVRWCTLHARRVAEERVQQPQFQAAVEYARRPIKIELTVSPDGWVLDTHGAALGAQVRGPIGDDTGLDGLEHALQQTIVHDAVPVDYLFGALWERGGA